MSPITIRPALPHDCASLAAIYAPYVEHTAISFEEIPPSNEEFAARVDKCRSRWEWLVAEIDGAVIGYAYGSEHRQRPAYRWSVEVSAYVAGAYHRRGIGRAVYDALLIRLGEKGFCNAFAGITLPNDASIGLHTRMGFIPVGVFRSAGWKFGRWHDVAWFQRRLRDEPPA
jgi:L-amino acid N-acyltransferase YncA